MHDEMDESQDEEDENSTFLKQHQQQQSSSSVIQNRLLKHSNINSNSNSNDSNSNGNRASAEHTESHQYEQDESEVWWHHQLQRHFEDKGYWWTFSRKTDMKRWTLTLFTGFCCGLAALCVTSFTKLLSNWKFSTFHRLLEQEKSGKLAAGTSFVFMFGINLVFASVAFLSVYIEPLAAGSGIPEIKCYLNGLNISSLVKMRTMVMKAFGIVFACAAGLPLGKEGPMVHIGAVIAATISQGRDIPLSMDAEFSRYQDFRNDREKRDFVACGAAAGVAAAFGAPIGGVLFSLEEGASFWSTSLTWRCFFCAMATVFFLYAFNTARHLFGHSDSAAMFSFGEFFSLQGEQSNYAVWELCLFTILGGLGGILGAVFNYCTSILFKWRSKFVNTQSIRYAEILLISATMSGIALVLSWSWKKCTPLPVDMEGWSDQEKALVTELVPLFCDVETEYNELASLYLADSDTAIRQLFHFREIGDHNDYTFSTAALLLFFVPYLTMACIIYGTAVPAGMFVPSLLSGAAFGRLIGHLLHKLDDSRGTFADSGTYALMGAAAITSGIARMTISLTVMILEATGDMQYVLPLMLTVMSARFIGNIFTEGLYEQHIHSRKLNFMDEDEGICKLVELHDLTVSDVMTPSPIHMYPLMIVGECYQLLQNNKHHCFPVVDNNNGNVLLGTVMRKVICTLLQQRAFTPSMVGNPRCPDGNKISPLLNWVTLEKNYPRYPDIDNINLTQSDKECWLDLGPYMDASPYIINEHTSLQRTYRMFRTLGLRHLCVVNRNHHILGIVTRGDLATTRVIEMSEGGPKRDKMNKINSKEKLSLEQRNETQRWTIKQ